MNKRSILTLIIALGLFSASQGLFAQTNERNELWIIVKNMDKHKGLEELGFVDSISRILEKEGLGTLDSHGGNGKQLKISYFSVTQFNKAKAKIDEFLLKNYPKLAYSVVREYNQEAMTPIRPK